MKKIEYLLARAFTPIRVNFAFFVFMFLLGYACTQLEVPDKKGYYPYELAPIELFLDLYVVCLILSFIPVKIRRWIRATMYGILYPVSIIDMYCFVRFGSTLTPTMLLLVGETNSSEASEFFTTYLDWNLLWSPIGLILLLMLAHIACNIIASRRKVHPAVRHKLTGRIGRIYQKLSPSDKAKVSIGAAAGGLLGVLSLILLYNGYTETINNKLATVRLMSYKNIGDVEHELTQKGRANLYLPIYRLAFSIYANKLASKQVDKLVAGIQDVKVDSCTFRSKHIVFVIGESYNKHHSQLYGYNHETTPRQVELRRKGNLIPFTDVIAPYNLTSFVFKNIFSLHAVGDKGDWCDDPLFPELFRKAGYRVAFITNQFLPQAKEAVYDFSGGFFLNNPILSKAQFDVRNTQLYKYDAGVLRDYDQIVMKDREDNPDVPRLTILHLKGQHTNYHDRFPPKRKYFHEGDYKKDWPEMSKRCRMLLADYDNATLYNDSIMGEVIKRFENEDAIVIYMSDHGEEAFGDGLELFGRNHSAVIDFRLAHEEYEIPLWIWYSKQYAKNHPDIVRQINHAAHRPFMTDNISQVLVYLAGIQTPFYRDDYNILSDDYDASRKRIIKGTVDYDELRMKHEEEMKTKKKDDENKHTHKDECSAMRGIAIMAIMLHNYCHWLNGTVRENEYKFHADRAAGMWQALTSPDDLFLANMLSFFGHYGVPVFLFLSGFGLVLKYENTTSPRHSTLGFMRIHYLKLLKMMVPGFVFFIIIDIMTPRSFHFYCDKIIEQGLMVINLFPEPNTWIWPGPYWFFGLMIELYLIYRLVMYRRPSWIVAAAIVVCFLAQVFCDPTGDTLNYLRYNAVGGILPFGCGILAARHLCGGALSAFTRGHWALLTLVASALVVVMSLYEISWYFAPVAVILATACLVKSLPHWLLHWSIWLGGISAAMFVTHPAMRKIFIPVSHRGDIYDGLMLYVIAAIGVAWGFERFKKLKN